MHNVLTFFRPRPGLIAINIHDRGISIVRVCRNHHDATPVITACLYRPVSGHKADLSNALQSLNHELGLKRSHCTTLLTADDYKLLLTDRPNVPEDELAAALSWQAKDLIDQPVDETTFEVFPAPAVADTTAPESSYVVAANNKAIQQRVDLLTHAKINLRSIDIQEMALRNLIMLMPEPEQTTALLWLNEKNGTLIIVRDGAIYMSRAVGIGMNSLCAETNKKQHHDSLMLEVQRSLDYYEARYQATPIHSIMLAPGIVDCSPSLPTSIQQALGIDVDTFDLDNYIDHSIDMPENWKTDFFITIGAALRDKKAAA